MRIACILLKSDEHKLSIAESLLRLSPQIALGDQRIYVEIGRCQKLYSEESFLSRVGFILAKFSVSARIGIGDSIPDALVRAKYKEKPLIEALHDYYSPFYEVNTLFPMISSLKKLGITQLSEFRQIPTSEISTRFGKAGLIAAMKMQNPDHPWPRFEPEEKLSEAINLETEPRSLEALFFPLKTILDRALARAKGKRKHVLKMRLELEQEKSSICPDPIRIWTFTFPTPQNSSLTMLSILRDRLQFDLDRYPLQSIVTALRVEFSELAPAQNLQKDFYTKEAIDQEAFDGFLARLIEKFGQNNVFFAELLEKYLPERAWKKTLQAKNNIIPHPQRPNRLNANPPLLQRKGKLLANGRQKWEMRTFQGPERITGEWWLRDRERDYYRVKTACGEELWIYSQGEKLYLHGIFD